MTENTIIPLFPEQSANNHNAIQGTFDASEQNERAFDVAFLKQLRTNAFWDSGDSAFSCAIYMPLGPLLEESPFLTLDCAMDHVEFLLCEMLGGTIQCMATPLITEADGMRTVELQIQLEGISAKNAKSTLGSTARSNVIAFDA